MRTKSPLLQLSKFSVFNHTQRTEIRLRWWTIQIFLEMSFPLQYVLGGNLVLWGLWYQDEVGDQMRHLGSIWSCSEFSRVHPCATWLDSGNFHTTRKSQPVVEIFWSCFLHIILCHVYWLYFGSFEICGSRWNLERNLNQKTYRRWCWPGSQNFIPHVVRPWHSRRFSRTCLKEPPTRWPYGLRSGWG